MLPIHESLGSKKVTHFIAIQKDVTFLLRKADRKSQDWSSVEVGNYTDFSRQNKITTYLLIRLHCGSIPSAWASMEKLPLLKR